MKYFNQTEVEKVYFSVGEAASIVGVAASNIRYWLIHFEIDGDVKRSNGKAVCGSKRKLTAKDINRLFEIKRLLHEEGFTIWGAKKKLSA